MEEQKNKSEGEGFSEAEVYPEAQESSKEIDELTTLHERVIASLSYIGFLAIIPFYLKKESKFCRFHGRQGLILAIVFFFAKPLMVLDLISDLVLLLEIGLFAYMGLAALGGRWKKLPFIYEYACKLEETLSLKKSEGNDEINEENENI